MNSSNTLERWFFLEANKGLIVIGTFYFKFQMPTRLSLFPKKINALQVKWLILPTTENKEMSSESEATLPPFGPKEGQKWFDRISSQWESQKNRFALIYFGKIRFLPPCIWNIPFVTYSLSVNLATFHLFLKTNEQMIATTRYFLPFPFLVFKQ